MFQIYDITKNIRHYKKIRGVKGPNFQVESIFSGFATLPVLVKHKLDKHLISMKRA